MKGGLSHQKGGRLGKGVDTMSVKIISALIESIKEIVRKSKSIEEILKALDDIQSQLR